MNIAFLIEYEHICQDTLLILSCTQMMDALSQTENFNGCDISAVFIIDNEVS
jgi:hypothetical protein